MIHSFLMLAQAGGGSAPAPPAGPAPFFVQMVPILLLFVVFYLLLIRPQQKQRKEHQKMISELRSGDKVVTSGGIHGTITNVKDKSFILRVADGVKIEIDKGSIGRLLEKSSGEETEKSK